MTSNEYEIEIDRRSQKLIGSFSITDIYDALTEIITNCDDSYHRLSKNNPHLRDGGDILIEIKSRRGKKPSLVIVSDKAEGMTDKNMKEKLGHIGRRTSQQEDRGFMGRGIKDCTALGEITVQSIRDKKYYSCKLTTKNTIQIEKPKDATSVLRKELGIPRRNGTVVTLHCKKI